MRTRGLAWSGLLLSACGGEIIVSPAGVQSPRIVVHLVLDASRAEQRALVRRTRLTPRLPETRDVNDPPETGARLVVYDATTGDSAVAVEGLSPNGESGAYRLFNANFAGGVATQRIRLVPGRVYRLRLATSLGVVTATTRIPFVPVPDLRTRVAFNIERDSLRTTATAVGAAGYLLGKHHESGGSSVWIFPELEQLLWAPYDGSIQRLERKFPFDYVRGFDFPGDQWTATVAAADSNYVKYYVAGFDPFGDDTQGNTVKGGVGLFGSIAPLFEQTLDLVATVDLPIEGRWVISSPATGMPTEVVLYDTRYRAPAGASSASLGLYGPGKNEGPLGERGIISGFMLKADSSLSLFWSGDRGSSTTLTGSARGGVLTLTIRNTSTTRVYRRP